MSADTADGGEEAIRMVAEKRYDLILMDHMMPGVDGIEAARRIRALEEEQRKKSAEPPESPNGIPIVALSANTVSGARELFLEAGMNDFISKPIEAPALNTALAKWLPSEKLCDSFSVEKLEISSPVENEDPTSLSPHPPVGEDDPLWAELKTIPGLDTEDGVSHTGGSREGYYRVLRQFVSGFDEGMRVIAEDVEKEDWKDYAIRLHAYKGVLAMIGQKTLSDWARWLEAAGKSAALTEDAPVLGAASAIALIKGVTAPICEALRVFRDALLATTLIPGKSSGEKTKISAAELTEQLNALQAACAAFKAGEANRIAALLEQVSVGGDAAGAANAALVEICRLVASLDYDKAVEKIAAFPALNRSRQ
jgi:CheY-like chemotaxis protein